MERGEKITAASVTRQGKPSVSLFPTRNCKNTTSYLSYFCGQLSPKENTPSTDLEGESEIENSAAMKHVRINTAVTSAVKKLAPTRTYQILAQRIQEWGLTPCRAEENDKKQLVQMCRQQNKSRFSACGDVFLVLMRKRN
ncbi:hypothetical protein OUZ56_025157 [Daphnia magna]|uniref:CpG binding protein C-terminal domain-containing protein n=1 Tax=Daphnia magna TaxID=35525 RepID=A0ABQ9ZJ09_9CRUS|nr:hypothetical protein OUZ56_025157 [Daphnia magna]